MSQTTEIQRPETAQAAVANPARTAPRTAVLPAVDIYENATGITLLADMPGVSKERLTLKVESDHLFIEGDAGSSATEGLKLGHVELRRPLYRRAFALGKELDKVNITAALKDGVLTVTIPRLPQAQPRKIEVSVS